MELRRIALHIASVETFLEAIDASDNCIRFAESRQTYSYKKENL